MAEKLVEHYRELLLQRYGWVTARLAAAEEDAKRRGEAGWPQVLARLYWLDAQVAWPAVRLILAEPFPALPDLPAAPNGPPPEDLLEQIAGLRQEVEAALRELPPAAWNRTGRHPRYGVRTLQWWVERCLAQSVQILQPYLLEA